MLFVFSQCWDLHCRYRSTSGCCCSVPQSCLTFCDHMDCSTPGFPVHHQLPEFIQTHVHQVDDATPPSHPLSPPSPLALNLSRHQGLSNESVLWIRGQSVGASASASVLPMNIQGWFPLGFTGLISLQSKDLPGGSVVKNLAAMQETQIQSLGQEDPLEKRRATHSHILVWRIPWTEGPDGLQSMELQSQTWLSD